MVFLHRFFDFRRGVILIMFGKNLFGLHMISFVQFALNNNTLVTGTITTSPRIVSIGQVKGWAKGRKIREPPSNGN